MNAAVSSGQQLGFWELMSIAIPGIVEMSLLTLLVAAPLLFLAYRHAKRMGRR